MEEIILPLLIIGAGVVFVSFMILEYKNGLREGYISGYKQGELDAICITAGWLINNVTPRYISNGNFDVEKFIEDYLADITDDPLLIKNVKDTMNNTDI